MAAFYKLNEWVDEVINEYKSQKDEVIESQPKSFKFRQRKQEHPQLGKNQLLISDNQEH